MPVIGVKKMEKTSNDQAGGISLLQRQLSRLVAVTPFEFLEPKFIKWRRDTEVAICHIFGSKSKHFNEFDVIMIQPIQGSRKKMAAEAILKSMIEELQEYPLKVSFMNHKESDVERISRICKKFNIIARQLQQRHDNRQTIEVNDEYDVQDLFHALLKLEFEDIRTEEWTPRYAGKSSRMDFLLKNEQIVVETKKTRKGLGEKEICDQLIIDIARYKSHADCKLLFCFVYDPDSLIANPAGIEKDLTRENNGVNVLVLVAPKGI
jgi:hypothetical protein